MDEKTKVALAAAVAGGYVLGRSKKGRLALTATAVLMGRSLEPRALLIEGVRRLRDVPQVSALGDQLRGEVYQAARTAAGAAVSRRLGSVSGRARPGTPEAEVPGLRDEDEGEAEGADVDEAGGGAEDETGTSAERSRKRRERSGRGEEREETAEEEPAKRPRKAAKQPARKTAQKPAKKAAQKPGTKPARKTPGKRSAPSDGSRGKPAAKKTSGGRSPSSTRTQRGR